MANIHPSSGDHTPDFIMQLAEEVRELSHEVDGSFDDLQDAANLLTDFASLWRGHKLVTLDGAETSLWTVSMPKPKEESQ